jgi:hypothetical protein
MYTPSSRPDFVRVVNPVGREPRARQCVPGYAPRQARIERWFGDYCYLWAAAPGLGWDEWWERGVEVEGAAAGVLDLVQESRAQRGAWGRTRASPGDS